MADYQAELAAARKRIDLLERWVAWQFVAGTRLWRPYTIDVARQRAVKLGISRATFERQLATLQIRQREWDRERNPPGSHRSILEEVCERLQEIESNLARSRSSTTAVDRARLLETLPITPEDTLRQAGISNKRQARYQRRMSSLLAGRA